MIIVLANVQVVPHHIDEARRIAREHVERSRLEPGCVSHAVYEDASRPNHLAFVEEWASEQALLAHFAVPASREFVNHLARLSASHTRIRLYQATEMPFPRAGG